jgi:hypothetical protein
VIGNVIAQQMDFTRVKEIFQEYGSKEDSSEEYEDTYNKLLSKRIDTNKIYIGDDFGESNRIHLNVLTYRQILLHRAIALFEGLLNALIAHNTYLMVLAIRGCFETTAAIGFLHNRLASLKNGNISARKLDEDLCIQVLGTRDKKLKETRPQVPDAKQVLNMLEYADRSVSKHIMNSSANEHVILDDCYKFLCEFAHPNFHSNATAIDLNKSVPEFVFRHGAPMREMDFNLIGYLPLATDLFLELFDSLTEYLPEME